MNRCLLALALGIASLASLSEARSQPTAAFQAREYREGDKKLPYRLLVPQAYDAAKQWPLVIWLHGSGDGGSNNTSQLSGIGGSYFGNREKCQALVMVPQCPSGSSWLAVGLNAPPKITEPSRMIVAAIGELKKEFALDERRIYIGGFSMGGCGSWDLLSRYPQLFAAAFPIAGPPGDRPGLAPLIKEVPIWVFQGDHDKVAPVESSRTIVAALKGVDAPVKYTEYRGGGHEMHQPLTDPQFPEWLLAQKRSADPVFTPSEVPANASLITKTLPHGTRDTWTGPVERTGHGVPRLVIGDVRYRLKPAAAAPVAVVERLERIAKGEVKGPHRISGQIELDDRAWLLVESIAAAEEGVAAEQGNDDPKKETANQADTKPWRVLMIGNSQCPTIIRQQLLEKLAASDKGARGIEVVGCVRGGASLRSHWEAGEAPETARGRIAGEKWDFVVLQEIYLIDEAAFQPYARKFHQLIKERGARTILFGTASILGDYPKGFEKLHRLHVAMGQELGTPIVDASQAYVRYFGENPSAELKESLFAKDRAHPGLQGSYLYSCLLYSAMTGRSPLGLAAPADIPAPVAKSLQEAAWAQHQETAAALKK